MTPASLLAKNQADYGRGPADEVRFAMLDPLVVAQAATDIAYLQMTPARGEAGSYVRMAALPATPTSTASPDSRPLTPDVAGTAGGVATALFTPTPGDAGTATTTPRPTASPTRLPPTGTPIKTSTAITPPNTPTPLLPTETSTLQPLTVTSTPIPSTNTPTIVPPITTPDSSDPPEDTPTPTPSAAAPILPSVAFETAAFSGNEGDAGRVITVSLSAATDQLVTVDYDSRDVEATAGRDYIPISDTLTFAPGEISRTFTVLFIDDPLDEYDETLHLTLSNARNAVIDGDNPATLTIIDNDVSPSVQFIAPVLGVNEGDTENTSIVVTLDTASTLPITVTYATADGTARTADLDYAATSGTLTFAPGQTSQFFEVSVVDDSDTESNESVQLSLDTPVNVTLGTTATATLWIVDDDSGGGCTGNSITPNIGSPDGIIAQIGCGSDLIVDLGSAPINTHAGYDLVYYERENPSNSNHIALDWVIVQVGTGTSGPWYTVFYWGDDIYDDNTNLPDYGSEDDNLDILMKDPLYGASPYKTGITIDVDQRAPAGTYRFVRIYSPSGGANEPSEVDAIQLLP